MKTTLSTNNITYKVFDMDRALRSHIIYPAMRKLSLHLERFGRTSGMNLALNRFVADMNERSIIAKVIMAFRNDRPVAWALHSEDKETDYNFRKRLEGEICFQIFVNPRYRRLGIGSELLKISKQLAGQKAVNVYYGSAPEFFKSNSKLHIKNVYRNEMVT